MISKVKNIISKFYFSLDNFLTRNTLKIYRFLFGSHLKIFFYLNDVTNNNGAFQFHNSVVSSRYIKKGFKVSYPERKYNKKQFVEKLDKTFNSIEGKKGTMFLCDVNSIIHRANQPKVGQREAIIFEVSPCLRKRNFLKFMSRNSYRSIFSRFKDSTKFVKNYF